MYNIAPRAFLACGAYHCRGRRMASHRVSRTNVKRHHRVWPWVLSIVGLFVAVLVLFGIAGFNVYRQSKEVQAHESRACL